MALPTFAHKGRAAGAANEAISHLLSSVLAPKVPEFALSFVLILKDLAQAAERNNMDILLRSRGLGY